MILVGNQRGGAKNLALHLLKDENDHVQVHELRGFASDDLVAALNESYALSRGTRCRKFLFSLSLNPPPEARVETAQFEDAIERAEERLGLCGQPRAIVFHEKEGRRHAHAVWSRIDTDEMKAVPLPHTKRKLRDLAREMYLEHGWTMPRGFADSKLRDPRNFTLAEWQQARRADRDPRAIKVALQECWAVSDTRQSFEAALRAHGFRLARGDRRGFVALDHRGEPFAVARAVGLKTKDVSVKLGNASALPCIDDCKRDIAREMSATTQRLRAEQAREVQAQRSAFEDMRAALVSRQRLDRESAFAAMERRAAQEAVTRQQRFRSGAKGLWDRIVGEHARIRRQNETEAFEALQRDRKEKDALIFRQIEERRALTVARAQDRNAAFDQFRALREERRRYRNMEIDTQLGARERFIEERRQGGAERARRGPEHDT